MFTWNQTTKYSLQFKKYKTQKTIPNNEYSLLRTNYSTNAQVFIDSVELFSLLFLFLFLLETEPTNVVKFILKWKKIV